MSSHVELNPDDSTLSLSLGMKAMRLALTQKTHKMGTVRIPGTGGTDVIIGDGAQDGANRIDQDGNQLPLVDTSGIDKAAQDAQQSADKAMTKADEAIAKGDWEAEVVMDGTEGGKIVVTAPAESSTGRVIVLLSDGESKTIMKTLTFVSGVMNVTTQSQEAAATPAGHSASASMAERVAASTPAATTSPTSETASSQEPPVERHQAPNEDVARTNADILRDRLPKS